MQLCQNSKLTLDVISWLENSGGNSDQENRTQSQKIYILAPRFPLYVTLYILFNLSFPNYKMQVMIVSPRTIEMNKQNTADKALSTVLSCHTVSTPYTSGYYHQSWNSCLSILMILFLPVA